MKAAAIGGMAASEMAGVASRQQRRSTCSNNKRGVARSYIFGIGGAKRNSGGVSGEKRAGQHQRRQSVIIG